MGSSPSALWCAGFGVVLTSSELTEARGSVNKTFSLLDFKACLVLDSSGQSAAAAAAQHWCLEFFHHETSEMFDARILEQINQPGNDARIGSHELAMYHIDQGLQIA